ncbi:hypothetical protein [Sinomonas sp. P47F7]|uniref:hypothetical protein n=1 Tax=Sinomonas sp. P47F7 TaxID=3410987 RepID=UPI003BF47FDB
MPSEPRHTREITVRRAPKYVPFLVAGGLVGAVVALAVGYLGTVPDGYTRESVFGYFLVLFGAAGVLLGGVVVLVLDRISVARSRKAYVEELPEEEEAPEAPEVGDGGKGEPEAQ